MLFANRTALLFSYYEHNRRNGLHIIINIKFSEFTGNIRKDTFKCKLIKLLNIIYSIIYMLYQNHQSLVQNHYKEDLHTNKFDKTIYNISGSAYNEYDEIYRTNLIDIISYSIMYFKIDLDYCIIVGGNYE